MKLAKELPFYLCSMTKLVTEKRAANAQNDRSVSKGAKNKDQAFCTAK